MDEFLIDFDDKIKPLRFYGRIRLHENLSTTGVYCDRLALEAVIDTFSMRVSTK